MSKVKIVLSGDNHLGKRQYNSPIREKDFQKAWLWVCSKVAEIDPDFFIMSGDMFDKKQIRDPVTLSVAIEGLSQCGQSKVIAIEGNHDGRSFIHKGRSWLEFLYGQGLVDHILRPNESLTNSGVTFMGAPWSGRSTISMFEAAIWELESYSDPEEEFRVGVFHAAPESYVMGAGTIPAKMLLGSKFDLILMGHCHRPFNIKDKVLCAGSPEICDAGEAGGGIWVIDVNLDTKKNHLELIEYEHREFTYYGLIGSAFTDEKAIAELSLYKPGTEPVIIVSIEGERAPVDFNAIKSHIQENYNPTLIRINDKMTAKADVKPKSGPGFFDGLVADLLGDKVTTEEFKSVLDCFESDDRGSVAPILLEVTDAR